MLQSEAVKSVHEKWAEIKSERLANIAKMVEGSDPGAFMVLRASTVRWLCLTSVSASRMISVLQKDLVGAKAKADRCSSEAERSKAKAAKFKEASDKVHKIYLAARELKSALKGLRSNMPKCGCNEAGCRVCTCLRVAEEALSTWNEVKDEFNPHKKTVANASV